MSHILKTRPGLALILGGLSLMIGCQDSSVEESSDPSTSVASSDSKVEGSGIPEAGSSSSETSESQVSPPVAPPARLQPWEQWEKPDLGILLTGEQHGFFEPCGCTANQLGGMSRRADLAKRAREAGWQLTGVDLGGLPRRTGRQAVIKTQTTMKALTQLDYMCVGLGAEELKLGIDGLLDIHLQEGDDASIRFVSANVRLLEGAIEDFPLETCVREFSGLKVGVTSVISRSISRQVFPMGDAEWLPAEPAIERTLSSFAEQEVDVRILLSHGTVEESQQLAEQFPQFQVIMTTLGIGDPDPNAPPLQVGDTLVIEAGRKGKHTGVLGVYNSDKGPSFKYKLVSLERDDFDDTQSMIQLMAAYQERLKEERVVLTDAQGPSHPSTATFVGADKCSECHTTAHDIWKDTGHAHGLEDLDPTFKHHGYERLNGVNRTFDPECLSCHVTGWDPQEYTRFRSGFLNKEFAATEPESQLHRILADNQCENCHGPGSRHVEMAENGDDEAGLSVRLTYEDAESKCIKCHDGDNSPNFEFEAYWEKVAHEGLD